MPHREDRFLGRRRNPTTLLLMLGLLYAGCAHRTASEPAGPEPRELLNSERIESRFGNYGIELLSGDAPVRVANLYSADGDRKTCRTFAVTVFPETVDDNLKAVHRQILAGGSIGATLKAAGWTVSKRQLGVGELPPSEDLYKVYALMRMPPKTMAFKAYDLYAARGSQSLLYATITEVHHPLHLKLSDLGSAADRPAADTEKLPRLLRRVEAAARGLAARN